MVIERYISLAHGLPPPPDICPYKSPHPSKNKAKPILSSSLKNVSGGGASIKTSNSPANSERQDSCVTEDDLVREVEESLQRRRKQLELPDDITFEEVEDDDDPTWDGSHYHVSRNLSSRLQRNRGRKKKQTVKQGNTHKIHQHTKNTSAAVCGEGKTPGKRGRPFKVNGVMKNQGNANKKKSSNEPVSDDTSTQPKKRGRPPKTNTMENQKNPLQDRTQDTRPSDDSNIPKKRRKPFKRKAPETQDIHNQDIPVKLKRPSGVSESIQSVYSNGDTEDQGSLDINGDITELVQEALGGSPVILHATSVEKNKIICLLETLDPVFIMITQPSPSEAREARETGRATEKELSIKTHKNNDLEVDTQQLEETVRTATNTEKRVNQQILGVNKIKPSKKLAAEVSTKKVGRKRGRSKTRNEFSHPSEVIQRSESTGEPPTLKKTKNEHCQRSEPISKAVKSIEEQRSESSVPTKLQVVTQMAKDAIPLLSEQNNNELVTSSKDKVTEKLRSDKSTEMKVKRQVRQQKHSYTSKSQIIPSSKASNLEIFNRSLPISTSEEPDMSIGEHSEEKEMAGFSESEAEDEDGWITTGDEDDTILELHSTKKKKTFLHQPQKDLKKKKHRTESRKSVSKLVFDDDDDILVLETPKARSENKENCFNSENSQTTKRGKNKHITSLPVSPKSQTQAKKYGSENNKQTADKHQGSLITSGSYIQGVVNNSMMQNIFSTMTTSLTKVPGKSQEEDLDPEDMLHLLQVPSLQHNPSSLPTSSASETSPQDSRVRVSFM